MSMSLAAVLTTMLAAPIWPAPDPGWRFAWQDEMPQDEPAEEFPDDEAPAEEPRAARRTSRARDATTDLRQDAERIRLRFGVFPAYGTLRGRIEKEDANVGPGSGGDKISLRSDLDMPLFSWSWRAEGLLEPAPHIRLRFGAELLRVEGGNTLSEGFRHDGRVFVTGDRIESELWGSQIDAEFHFLPRQALRRNAEFGLFTGVRFGYFENTIEQPQVVRVSGRTTGVWPRFGVQGYGPLGSGMTIWGESAIGGWISGDSANWYGAASFDFAVGLGWSKDHVVDVRIGYHYSTFGIWRERGNDMERLTLERNQLVFGVLFWTP